jgi:hypothetical protein
MRKGGTQSLSEIAKLPQTSSKVMEGLGMRPIPMNPVHDLQRGGQERRTESMHLEAHFLVRRGIAQCLGPGQRICQGLPDLDSRKALGHGTLKTLGKKPPKDLPESQEDRSQSLAHLSLQLSPAPLGFLVLSEKKLAKKAFLSAP